MLRVSRKLARMRFLVLIEHNMDIRLQITIGLYQNLLEFYSFVIPCLKINV